MVLVNHLVGKPHKILKFQQEFVVFEAPNGCGLNLFAQVWKKSKPLNPEPRLGFSSVFLECSNPNLGVVQVWFRFRKGSELVWNLSGGA
jgi:hypothetical protein